eukprot:5705822-Pleurochrysis_carterae.AAC.3
MRKARARHALPSRLACAVCASDTHTRTHAHAYPHGRGGWFAASQALVVSAGLVVFLIGYRAPPKAEVRTRRPQAPRELKRGQYIPNTYPRHTFIA